MGASFIIRKINARKIYYKYFLIVYLQIFDILIAVKEIKCAEVVSRGEVDTCGVQSEEV